MGKCMKCGGSKKMGYMDLGGNFVDMTSQYKAVEPTSGYGTSEANRCPPNCSKKTAPKSRSGGIDYEKRRRQQQKIKPRGCRKGPSGQTICD